MINDFLGYIGASDSNDKPKPANSRRPRAVAMPAAKTVAVSKTVVLSSGLLSVSPVPVAPPAPVKRDIELVPYSDKSFAIFGDTKPIKDRLIDLGGSFNSWLKRDGKSTPGFIFSNKRLDTVRKTLNL